MTSSNRLYLFDTTLRDGAQTQGVDFTVADKVAIARNVCMVGKTWDFHVDVALEVDRNEYLEMISDSLAYAKDRMDEVMFDAEHFFDGYKANPDYAMACLAAAEKAGARWLVLCDTNGGTLPHEIERIVGDVVK